MSVEKDLNEIWYDNDPFTATYSCKCGRIKGHKGIVCDFCETECGYTGDLNARYKGEIQNQLNRDKPFGAIPDEYYYSLWQGIANDATCMKYINGSSFIQKYLPEITNRLCTECEFVTEIELNPSRYIGYSTEDCLPPILRYLDWALNTCRYGKNTVEKMENTVEQDNIDEFLSTVSLIAAERLAIYITRH